MKFQRPIPTSRRLWAAFSVAAFVLLGFVDIWGTTKTHGAYWPYLAHDLTRWEWWRVPLVFGYLTMLIAVPAIVIGWVLQAVVVTARSEMVHRSPKQSPDPS
jgi:hypothetical protein